MTHKKMIQRKRKKSIVCSLKIIFLVIASSNLGSLSEDGRSSSAEPEELKGRYGEDTDIFSKRCTVKGQDAMAESCSKVIFT